MNKLKNALIIIVILLIAGYAIVATNPGLRKKFLSDLRSVKAFGKRTWRPNEPIGNKRPPDVVIHGISAPDGRHYR